MHVHITEQQQNDFHTLVVLTSRYIGLSPVKQTGLTRKPVKSAIPSQ